MGFNQPFPLDFIKKASPVNKHDIQLLYAYNRWANARILATAAKLTAAQYLAPGKLPDGGLRGTLLHTLFAEWLWRMRWLGAAPDYRYWLQPENFPTFASLHARWTDEEDILMQFVAALTDNLRDVPGSILDFPCGSGRVTRHLRAFFPDSRLVACDLSASPYIDLAGARMLHDLHDELASRHVTFCIVGAHAQLRDLLRAEGLAEKTDSGEWLRTLDSVLDEGKARERSGLRVERPPGP